MGKCVEHCRIVVLALGIRDSLSVGNKCLEMEFFVLSRVAHEVATSELEQQMVTVELKSSLSSILKFCSGFHINPPFKAK